MKMWVSSLYKLGHCEHPQNEAIPRACAVGTLVNVVGTAGNQCMVLPVSTMGTIMMCTFIWNVTVMMQVDCCRKSTRQTSFQSSLGRNAWICCMHSLEQHCPFHQGSVVGADGRSIVFSKSSWQPHHCGSHQAGRIGIHILQIILASSGHRRWHVLAPLPPPYPSGHAA